MKRIILLLIVIALSAPAAYARAAVTRVQGDAWIEASARAGALVRRPAAVGAIAGPGERITTGRNGVVSVLLSDASRIEIRPNTSIIVEKGRASTTAIAVSEGNVRVRASAYRWPQEALHITSPTVTAGVRGTVFEVTVAQTGDAFLYVEKGVVTARDSDVSAGEAAALTSDGPEAPTRVDDAEAAKTNWSQRQRQRMMSDRKKIFESMASLLQAALKQRAQTGAVLLATIREIGESQKEQGDDPRLAGLAKLGRLITAIRNGAEKSRAILTSDREAVLREEILRRLVAEGQAPPFALAAARQALAAAQRERDRRDRDLASLNTTLDRLGAALVFIASVAAGDPSGDRSAAKIISEGLGLPMKSEPLSGSIPTLSRDDLGLNPRTSWAAMRTFKGREDFRVPVRVHVSSNASGLTLAKTPEAFDTPLAVHLTESDTALWIDQWDGLPQITAQRPALLYRFPITVGDTWIAWRFFSGPQGGWRIERSVTAYERIHTPLGECDCLRIETRFRQGRNTFSPLISVEWIAPGTGVVREISFRGELKSISWEDRIPVATDN